MATAITIPKNKSSFPEHLDFYKLRELGLKHISQLSEQIWTDHNLHDPGITILETLCYAITDLGYRANFDIKDLLARNVSEKSSAGRDLFGLPSDSNFFTAANILGCNPVTATDYRKLFIDIPGVKNAWLEKSEGQEVAIEINCDKKELYVKPAGSNATSSKSSVLLNGLYDIIIEIDPIQTTDACGRAVESREGIIERVYEVFHKHRNLCEDVRDVKIFGEEEIAICADIELDASAIPEEVMLNISLKVEEFLSPTLHFYTLQEMLEKNKTIEEIYEGRPLSKDLFEQSNNDEDCLNILPGKGFIDVDELEKLNPKEYIHVSDIHREIMDVAGVKAIHRLVLVNYVNNEPHTKGESWCIKTTKGYRQHIGILKSNINFLKGPLYFSYDSDAVIQRFKEEKFAKSKACLQAYQLDLPVPEGMYHELNDYTSIVHEFPTTYSVGNNGLASPKTALHAAQAKQLKAFLIFFDQILANYLSQLSHVRDLFSMQKDSDERRGENAKTYFSQILHDIPEIDDIIREYEACQKQCSSDVEPEDYPGYLDFITENEDTYHSRRNRFLDHLLARFSESFTDYVTQMYKLQKETIDQDQIINSKSAFLEQYPEISRNRGKAFDILSPESAWDSENVAGLKQRISALLGIEEFGRKTLSHGNVSEIKGEPINISFSLSDVSSEESEENKEKIVRLVSKKLFTSQADAGVGEIEKALSNRKNYQILTYSIPNKEGYSFSILDENGNDLVRSTQEFLNIEAMAQAVEKLQALFKKPDAELESKEQYVFPEEPKNYKYHVVDTNGNTVLESTTVYFSKEIAEESIKTLKKQISDKKNYKKQQIVLENACEYSFALLKESNCPYEILMESERFYTYEESLNAMHFFLNKIILGDEISLAIDQETECFEYKLYDSAHDDVIFNSFRGYCSETLALHYPNAENVESGYWKFEELAVDINHYWDIKNQGKFGFELHAETADNDSVPRFEKYQGKYNHSFFRLLDSNHEIILQSEECGDCDAGILLAIANAADAENFELRKTKNDQFYFVLKNGRDILGTSEIYESKEDAENGIASLQEIVTEVSSKAQEVTIEAVHPFLYDTEQESSDRKWAIKYYIDTIPFQPAKIGGNQGEFKIEILDKKGNEVLVSPPEYSENYDGEKIAYKTERLAIRAANNIRSRACDESGIYYKKIDDFEGDLPFGFQILDKDKQTVIADHSPKYATEEDRDQAITMLMYGMRNQKSTFRHLPEDGKYRYELLGLNFELLMRSNDLYEDNTACEDGIQELKKYVCSIDNYKLVKKDVLDKVNKSNPCFDIFKGEDGQFYFHLKAKNGQIILQSEAYKSKQGCKKGIASVRANSSLDKNFDRRTAKNGQDYFVLIAQNNEIIGVSETYTAKAGMENGIASVRENAPIANLNDTTIENGHIVYSFSIVDNSKKVLAYHTEYYSTEQERDMAIQVMINYLCSVEYSRNISGTPGTFTFELWGKDNTAILLESATHYDDEYTARKTFEEMVDVVQQYGGVNFSITFTDNVYSFELKNADGDVIAVPPKTAHFISESECDAAIDVIVAYLRNDIVQYEIENIGGAFYSEISDHHENLLLQGTILSPSKKKAEIELDKLVNTRSDGYASNPDNYILIDDEQDICKYSYAVVGSSNSTGNAETILAESPFSFNSEQEAYRSVENSLSWIADYKKLKNDIIKARDWQVLSSWNDNELLYIDNEYLATNGSDIYQEVAQQKEAYSIEKNSGGFYSVIIRNSKGEIIAQHKNKFSNKNDAEKFIDSTAFLHKLNGLHVDVSDEEYAIYYENGKKALVSKEGLGGLQRLELALEKGVEKSNYTLLPEVETENVSGESADNKPQDTDETQAQVEQTEIKYSFSLQSNGAVIAEHTEEYSSAQERDDALDLLIETLQKNFIKENIAGKEKSYYYELGTFGFGDEADSILLSSKNELEYFAKEEAKDNYESSIILALESSNFTKTLTRVAADENGNNCSYSFDVMNSEEKIVFKHFISYTCQKTRDEAILKIIDILRERFIKTNIKGTTCGYKFELTYIFDSSDEIAEPVSEGAESSTQIASSFTVTIKNIHNYPSEGEARKAVNLLLELLSDAENYSLCEDGSALWLISEDSLPLASIYSDGEADEVREKLIELFGQNDSDLYIETGINPEAISYQFSLGNGKPDLLLGEKISVKKIIETIVNEESNDSGREATEEEIEEALLLAKDYAWESGNQISALGQITENIWSVSNARKCLHGFAIMNNQGELLASHNMLYCGEDESMKEQTDVVKLLNAEGFHLLEHLLLRPRTIPPHPHYHILIKKEVHSEYEVLLRGIITGRDEESSYPAFTEYVGNIIKNFSGSNVDSQVITCNDGGESENPSQQIILKDGENIIAVSDKIYEDEELLDADKAFLIDLLLDIKNSQSDKETYGEKVQGIIASDRTPKELEGELLLPVPFLCNDSSSCCCPELSDPYSFRLSIVIPYWPKRFNDPEFREFMENMIRRETPAHILPRICWLDTKQMKEFEDSYRSWLKTLSRDNKHCNAVNAKNDVIEILTKLRSKYPEAQLYSCDQSMSENNIVVLDHTQLG